MPESVKRWVGVSKEPADQAMLCPSAWSNDYYDFYVLCHIFLLCREVYK